jgi:aspartyl protease family protein
MRYFILLLISVLAILGCDHPESKVYERNLGDAGVNISKFNNGNTNAEEANLERTGNVLEMEVDDGVRYVWVEINGIKLRFIFDTGASNICISPAEATVLYRQGKLRKEDILDVEYFQDATGRISEGTTINLRAVKIGNLELENVRATIVNNVNAPLLLGQTVLERFGKIEIDNDNNQIVFR